MALEGVTIGASAPAGAVPQPASSGALSGVKIGASAAAVAAPKSQALPGVTFPGSTTLDTSNSKIADNVNSMLPKAKPADTSGLFSKFLGLNPSPTASVNTETSTPIVKGAQASKNLPDSTVDLPKNPIKAVGDIANDALIKVPGELLGSTPFIKQAASGIDQGSVAGNFGQNMAQKLALGLKTVTGLTGGQYQTPQDEESQATLNKAATDIFNEVSGADTEMAQAKANQPNQDLLGKGLSTLAQGLGMMLSIGGDAEAGISGLSALGKTNIGLKAGDLLTNLVNKFPLVAKYIGPHIQSLIENTAGIAAYGQLDPNLGSDLKTRGEKLLVDIGTAPLYTALGSIKNSAIGLPVSFGLGFGMAKLSGASNQDATASGLAFSFLDAAGRLNGTRGFTSDEIRTKLNDEALSILQPYSKTKLTTDSSIEDIKAAYRSAAHQTHPDVGGTAEAFSKVQSAFDLLSKGAVSNAPKGQTEAEQSIKALSGDVQKGIEVHGADATHEALKVNLGVDDATATRIVKANSVAKLEDLPEVHQKIISDLLGKRSDDIVTKQANEYVDKNIDKLTGDYVKKFGNEVGTDEAKELVPGYEFDRSIGNLIQDSAGKIAQATFDKLVDEDKNNTNRVLISAGGTGAGKSTLLKTGTFNTKDFAAIRDSNMNNADAAIKRIDGVLAKGKDVHVAFVYAPIREAYNRALTRTENMTRKLGSGRPVAAQGHIETHHGSYNTMEKLLEHYKDNPKVVINIFDNSGSNPTLIKDPLAFIKEVIYNKEDEEQLHTDLNNQRIAAHREGGISDKTNKAYERAEKVQPREIKPGPSEGNESNSKERTENGRVAESVLNFQSGKIDVGAIIKDADAAIQDFVEKTMVPVALSENLTDSFAKLEGAAQADLETVNKLIEKLPIDKETDEALYHAAEDPNAPLTEAQRSLKERFDTPLQKINQALYERIKNDGTPLPDDGTYIARFPKEKPSAMQRVFNPAKGRGATASQGSILSKSSPSFKKRTMKILTDEEGNRIVASIKKGKVTAFEDGKPTELGNLKITTTDKQMEGEIAPYQKKIVDLQKEQAILSATKGRTAASTKRLASIKKEIVKATNSIAEIEDKYAAQSLNGKVFTDKNGTSYKIGDATTKEIEANTDLEYYHSAMASRLMQFVKLRQIDRASQFTQSWKESDDFKKISVPSDKIPPAGWKLTKNVFFRNYYFEPRIAEILDDQQDQMNSGNYNNAFTGVNRVLADAIFFNGLAHPINVFVTHLVNRGVSGLVYPPSVIRGIKAGQRALKAMNEKNEDYMELLRNGAHLMSSNVTNQKVAENLARKLSDDLDNKPDLRDRLLNALGYTLGQASFKTNVIYKLSHDMAWLSNDFFTMQSIFEAMEERGLSMEDAVKETARFIPDYRRKARLLDRPLSAVGKLLGNQEAGGNTGRFIADKLVYNSGISMFGSYHVGLQEALKNIALDNAKGTDWTFSAESNVQRLKAADKLAMLTLLMLIIGPWLDEKAQEAFGPTSYITRSGITKYPYLAYKLATGETTSSQAAQQIITPSVLVWEALQQFTDHDFFTGDQITGPGNEGRINHALDAVAPFAEFQKVASGKASLAEFGATLLGVHTPKNTQIAYDLNSMIYDEKPRVNSQVKALIDAGDETGALEKAQDFNSRLQDLIRENDILSNGATTDDRVSYFLNQYGLKMPGETAMANYAAKKGLNIIQKTLPDGTPVVKENTPLPAEGIVGLVTTYAKAIGTDPVEAFQLMFSGQTFKNVENGAIIVNRMSLAQSTAVKEAGGGNNPDFKLDHIVPLEGGGDNGADNLQLIPTAQWASNTNVENFIGDQLKAGNMSKDQAREIAIRFKAGQGELLSPAVLKEYNDKYKGQPLTEQEVYNYSNTLK